MVYSINENRKYIEERLPPSLIGVVAMRIDLLLFAFSTDQNLQWIHPILVTISFCFAIVLVSLVSLSMIERLVDIYSCTLREL